MTPTIPLRKVMTQITKMTPWTTFKLVDEGRLALPDLAFDVSDEIRNLGTRERQVRHARMMRVR